MRALLLTLWFLMAAAIVMMMVHPAVGVAWGSPAVTISIGVVGLGLCLHARERGLETVAEAADADDLPLARD